MSGKSGSGKTALMCSWISDLTRRGKRVVIWHSAEDTHAMWERRIELMGGDLRFVRFVESRSKVWDVLKDQNLPEVVVIDPLQQFIPAGAKNDEMVQFDLNWLTARAAKHGLAIVAIMHWKEHYTDKLVGSEAVWQIARIVHKVEKGARENHWVLRRVRAQNARTDWVRHFHTYSTGPNEPVLAQFDSAWEPPGDGAQDQQSEMERFILEVTGGKPYPITNLMRSIREAGGEYNYRSQMTPWFRRNSWRRIIAGWAGAHYVVPPGYRWNRGNKQEDHRTLAEKGVRARRRECVD